MRRNCRSREPRAATMLTSQQRCPHWRSKRSRTIATTTEIAISAPSFACSSLQAMPRLRWPPLNSGSPSTSMDRVWSRPTSRSARGSTPVLSCARPSSTNRSTTPSAPHTAQPLRNMTTTGHPMSHGHRGTFPGAIRGGVQAILDRQKDKDTIALADAVQLISRWALYSTSNASWKLSQELEQEDVIRRARTRYIVDTDVLIRTKQGATLAAIVVRPRDGARRPTALRAVIQTDFASSRIRQSTPPREAMSVSTSTRAASA